ncbi:hypothetical protein XA68_10791 [Ophiocordyceps unilateralis]|uniref:Uncharacterized protein n=1 Tax=Ophiocordyceps unilateralis TaxID=268505 RepID=A0A2A9PGT1_OPHUN|nr:hypothetical protein XA68_10791 [Ophiocordyceps unilateralis]
MAQARNASATSHRLGKAARRWRWCSSCPSGSRCRSCWRCSRATLTRATDEALQYSNLFLPHKKRSLPSTRQPGEAIPSAVL